MGPANCLTVGIDNGHHGLTFAAEGFLERMAVEVKNATMHVRGNRHQEDRKGFTLYETDVSAAKPKKVTDPQVTASPFDRGRAARSDLTRHRQL